MSIDIVRGIVEEELDSNWATTDIDFDNTKYTPKIGTPFVRITLDLVHSEPRSKSCERGFYAISIQVFTPSGEGTGRNLRYAETILSLYRGKSIQGVKYTSSNIQRVGDEREWHQRNVNIEAYYDYNY